MSSRNPLALTIVQGKRFQKVFRWGSDVKVYKPIAGMPAVTPARFTVNGHGLPDGWPFRVTSIVQGPTQLNDRWYKSRVIDANTIEVNAVNAGGLPAWSSGGFIEYFTPVDLAGYSARAYFKQSPADVAAVLTLTDSNGKILLDNTLKTITFDVPDTETASITVLAGTWDLEMVSGGSVSTPLPEGPLPPWRLILEDAK